MSGVEQMIRDRRLAVWREMSALAAAVAAEDRYYFSAADLNRWDDLNSQLAILDRRIAQFGPAGGVPVRPAGRKPQLVIRPLAYREMMP